MSCSVVYHVMSYHIILYSECLMVLIEVINKSLIPYCGSNDNKSTRVSLSDILFSFMLEKYIVCNVCGQRSPFFVFSSVFYITPTYTSPTQELIKQGMQHKLEKSCFRCKKNTWHVESNYILQPPMYLVITVYRFRYINNNVTKDRCSIPVDMTVVLGLHKFSLQAIMDHLCILGIISLRSELAFTFATCDWLLW